MMLAGAVNRAGPKRQSPKFPRCNTISMLSGGQAIPACPDRQDCLSSTHSGESHG